jgi:hypothetical protein
MASKISPSYHPSRNFDDTLDALVRLVTSAKWSFPGSDLAQLELDVKEQREERAALAALRAETARKEAEFAQRQHARFNRFSAVLNAARGAFRHDAAVLAELEQFKRRATSRTPVRVQPSTNTP